LGTGLKYVSINEVINTHSLIDIGISFMCYDLVKGFIHIKFEYPVFQLNPMECRACSRRELQWPRGRITCN